jgi:hypothetical protein
VSSQEAVTCQADNLGVAISLRYPLRSPDSWLGPARRNPDNLATDSFCGRQCRVPGAATSQEWGRCARLGPTSVGRGRGSAANGCEKCKRPRWWASSSAGASFATGWRGSNPARRRARAVVSKRGRRIDPATGALGHGRPVGDSGRPAGSGRSSWANSFELVKEDFNTGQNPRQSQKSNRLSYS